MTLLGGNSTSTNKRTSIANTSTKITSLRGRGSTNRSLLLHHQLQHARSSSCSVAKIVLCLLLLAICVIFAESVAFLRTIQLNSELNTPNTNKQQQKSSNAAGNVDSTTTTTITTTTTTSKSNVLLVIESVRNEFYTRYGGKEQAMQLWNKGVTVLGSQEATAKRILQAAAVEEPFVLSFAGYSVTVGRGNYFSQSFPFVLERILQPVLEQTHVHVLVRNAAIGGIPSFPYAFCFGHFLGQDAQVVSWDFSMNEGKGTAVLESYIRHSQVQLPNRPMMILLEGSNDDDRCNMMKQYIEQDMLLDAMCVKMPKNIIDPHVFKEQKELPPGLQDWEEFGAPKTCPGRGSWHPKKMEHEMIGWIMAVYFLDAMETAYKIMTTDPEWHEKYRVSQEQDKAAMLPAPTFKTPFTASLPDNGLAMRHILYGHEDNKVHHVSCRTNFLPAVDHDKTLPSIVVSGWNDKTTADNIMQERTDDEYSAGWVLDVSTLERDTKVRVEKCGGLGYIDMKIAMYGIPASGTMRLWLPASGGPAHDNHAHNNNKSIDKEEENEDDSKYALHWFDEIVICEANEKRGDDACKLDADVEYTVGGVPVETVRMVAGAGEYLKRRTCAHIEIPPTAKTVSLKELTNSDGQPLSSTVKQRLVAGGGGSSHDDDDQVVGLVVDVKAKSHVTRADGACCISHVVWEEH